MFQMDEQAMQQINERPAFPNRWPAEFGLLLRRAWKQQSRDRLPQARLAATLARCTQPGHDGKPVGMRAPTCNPPQCCR